MQIAMPNRLQEVLLAVAFMALAACQPDGAGGATSAGAVDTAADVAAAAGAEGGDLAAAGGLESDAAKASYIVGYRFTASVKSQFPVSVDEAAFKAGVAASLAGEPSLVPEEEAQKAMTALEVAQREATEVSALANGREGAEFLADNGAREGVVTTPSGLQYEVITEGDGAKPTESDSVTTHYEGKLLNGEVFDSSVARGEPASFLLNRVIPGWTEALQLMSVGSKYRLFIPPDLAYGNQGSPGAIPPQSTLIFEVELLEIQGAQPAE